MRDFERSLATVVKSVGAAVTDMEEAARTMSGVVAETKDR